MVFTTVLQPACENIANMMVRNGSAPLGQLDMSCPRPAHRWQGLSRGGLVHSRAMWPGRPHLKHLRTCVT